jgi:hypothetical protein
MEKETMLGGFATILFYAMSWALCGIVMFSFLSVRHGVRSAHYCCPFSPPLLLLLLLLLLTHTAPFDHNLQYNESVLQTLVPKTVDGLKVDLGVDVKFIGYTGECINTADDGGRWSSSVIKAAGASSPAGNPSTKVEVVCGETEIDVRWECVNCEVTAPQVVVDLYNGDKDSTGHVASAAAIFWQLVATPAVPDEVNGVNGTLIAPLLNGESSVFRGPDNNIVTVNLIPATYANSITKVQMMSFRVQHDSDLIGSVVAREDYMARSLRNSVKFELSMVSDVVQLDTIIAPKQTWLDVWAIAGGLFASIGATVILLMNFAESVLACCGMMTKKKVKEVKKKKGGGKKKKKKGKGGKGGGKGGKGVNMYDADAKGKKPGGAMDQFTKKADDEKSGVEKSGVSKKDGGKSGKDDALMSAEELKALAEKRHADKTAKSAMPGGKSAREKSGVSKSRKSGKEGDGDEEDDENEPKWENITQKQAAKYLDRMRARGQMRKQSRMATMSLTDANGGGFSPPGSTPSSMPTSMPTSMGGSPLAMSMPGSMPQSMPQSINGSMPQSKNGSQFASPLFSLPGSMPGSQGGSMAGSMPASAPGSRGFSMPGSLQGSTAASPSGSMPGSRFGSVAGSMAG